MISSVVVLYHPNLKGLEDLIDSLNEQCDSVIIVDNTPKNEKKYGKYFFNKYSKVYYLSLNENLGIAKAQNEGILKAKEIGSEFIIIFDQDSSIDQNFVKPLVDLYEKLINEGKKVAAIGPSFIDIKSNVLSPAITYNGFKIKKVIPDISCESTKSDHIISSGSVTHINTFSEVGLMDEKLFIDYVDLEWGMRAKKKGFTCYIANNVKMRHSIGDKSVKIPFINKTANIHSDFRKYFIIRNAFYLAFYSNLDNFWRIHQVIKSFKYLAFLIIYVSPRLNNLKIFFIAFFDALFKKMNKGRMK